MVSSTMRLMTNKILIIGLLTIMLTGCSVSTDNFPSPEELKIAIAKSISIPFDTKDTLVYDSFIGICGNSSRDELNRYYEPHLNEKPYLNVLKKQHSGLVVVTGDSLDNVMMTRFGATQVDCESPWDCFSKDKIRLSVFGEAVTNSSVRINEMYSYKGQSRSFQKLFSYNDGQWTYKTISEK